MKRYLLAVTVASTLALALASGCGGSGSGGTGGTKGTGSGGTKGTGSGGTKGSGGSAGSGGGAFNCDYKEAVGTASYEYCYSYSGLSSSQTTAEQTACKAFPMSTTPSSCPSGATDSCENIPLAGSSITYGYAIYNLPSSAVTGSMSACTALKGTWK
jgi:hypothetical protein